MKIAMLGVENSHAEAFCNLIKKNRRKYGDIEIVGVYSDETEAAQKLVDAGFTTYMAKSYDEFVGQVDGVMITARHGDNHLKYACAYIEKGIPCFIDKPFCADLESALKLVKIAQENNANLCGGSCLKFIDEIKPLAEVARNEKIIRGTVSCPVNMVNRYGNFWFYSQHLTEILITVFGKGVKSIIAHCPDETKNRVTAIFNYGDFDVCGFYTDSYKYAASLTTKDNKIHNTECVEVTYTYKNELDEFIEMVRTKVMPVSYDDLVYPVKLLDAIERSYREKKEIVIE